MDDDEHAARREAHVATGCQGGFDEGWDAGVAFGRATAHEQARNESIADFRSMAPFPTGAGTPWLEHVFGEGQPLDRQVEVPVDPDLAVVRYDGQLVPPGLLEVLATADKLLDDGLPGDLTLAGRPARFCHPEGPDGALTMEVLHEPWAEHIHGDGTVSHYPDTGTGPPADLLAKRSALEPAADD